MNATILSCLVRCRVLLLVCLFITTLYSQSMSPRLYEPGSPNYTDLWVDPVNGNDENTGAARNTAFRTLIAAWNAVPIRETFTRAYRIQVTPGSLAESQLPHFMESRYGTAAFPLLIQAADGPGTVTFLNGLNIYDCRYIYLKDLTIGHPQTGGDVLHYELCNYVYVRNCILVANRAIAQETVKLNQCQYVYFEGNDISGAGDNAVDCVAVQYGHFVDNKIHNAEDWCMYLKGGSAYFRVESNEFYNGGTGGFTAGQGTGFEFMTSPWLHYEAYDIKCINNLVHDTEGAAFGVQGGYNILIANNTAYRTGARSHLFEAVAGSRSCDGNAAVCAANNSAGGWGPRATGSENRIPNRNVYIYNNIFYNPAGYQSQWQHLTVFGADSSENGSNIPNPVRYDDNLQIRGNIIWNGPVDHPIGVGDGSGCPDENPSCSAAQLVADNAFNTLEPQFIHAAGGDFRPLPGGNLFGAATFAVPAFVGGDRPATPASPAGNGENTNTRDFNGAARGSAIVPGALDGTGTSNGGGGNTYRLYLPHYTFLGGNWSTELTLANPTDNAQTVTIAAFDNQGAAAGQFQVTLPANGGWSQRLEALTPALGAQVGWLRIGTDHLDVRGIMKFTFVSTGGTSSLPVVSRGGTRLLLPLAEINSAFFSGFALVNLSDTSTTVQIRLSSMDGTVQRDHQLTLTAGQKIVSLVSDLFGSGLPEKMSLRVTSQVPLTGFALGFANGITQIVAVPAEVLE